MKDETVFLDELRKELSEFTSEVFSDKVLTVGLDTLDKDVMELLDDRIMKKMSWYRLQNKHDDVAAMIHAKYRKMLRNLCSSCHFLSTNGCTKKNVDDIMENRPDIYTLLNITNRRFTYSEKVRIIQTDTRKIIAYPGSEIKETLDEFVRRFYGKYDVLGRKNIEFLFDTYFI